MPARVKPRPTKKSSVVRSTVTGKVIMKKPSPKKPSPMKPSPFANELARLKRTLKAQRDAYNRMLNNEIRKAEARVAKSKPNTFANIGTMAFNEARTKKNKNGNVIMRNASPR